MAEKKFLKKEAVRFGWQIMKQNLGFFIKFWIVIILIYIVIDIVRSFLVLLVKEGLPPTFFPLTFLIVSIAHIGNIFLDIIVSLGLIKIALNFCDNIESKIGDIFSQYKLFFRYLFASILFVLTTLAGLILLIIPGIYFAIRFQFFGCFIVDKRSGIIESLKKSWAITRGSVWNLFLLDLLFVLINFLGALLLLVGLFATIPTTMMAYAFVYRKLLAQKTQVISPGFSWSLTPEQK